MCEHVEEMRRLVGDLEGQREREGQAFAEGFRIGFQDGWDIGYGHAHEEMAREWHALAQRVQALGKGRS
jgi:flagellar biosynthesis/type III secretory pathway protein FliH